MKRLMIVAAVCTAALAVPAAAYADEDVRNAGAGVTGVAPRPASEGCPAGNFCIYTGPNWSGRVFRLYHCREYALTHWGGYGSVYNNNTGGAHGVILDQYHGVIDDTTPGYEHPAYDFEPVWYIRAC
jgi:Peptidase inhibitor family I36